MKLHTLIASAAMAGTLVLSTTAFADTALYDKQFGGKAGMAKITHEMMVLVLADPRIKDFFAKTDIERLEFLLAEQFCELIGGPCKYSGRDMKRIHEGQNINTAHFNFLAEHLQVAMENNNVPTWAQNKLIAKLAPMHGDVTGRP
jgi:hemoglobin